MSNISEQTSLRKIFWLCVQEIPYPLNFNERPPQIYLANNSSSFSLFIVPTSGNYQRTNSEHNSQCLGCQLVELLIARHFRFQSESNEKKTWTKFELVEKKHVTTSRLTLVKITPQRKKLRFQIHYSVRPKGSEKARTWIEVDLFTCYIILCCVTYKTHKCRWRQVETVSLGLYPRCSSGDVRLFTRSRSSRARFFDRPHLPRETIKFLFVACFRQNWQINWTNK